MSENNISTEEAEEILATYHAECSGLSYEDALADIQGPDEAETAVMIMLFEIKRGIAFSQACVDHPEKKARQIMDGLRVTSHADANKTVHGDTLDEQQIDRYFEKEASMLAAQFRFTVDEHKAVIDLLNEKRDTIRQAANTLNISHNDGIFTQPNNPEA